MVFSSVPVYLDPPNWQQQPNHEAGGGGGTHNNRQLRPPLPPPPPLGGGGGGGGGGTAASIRPCSMADRARLAKLPQPEIALKCPRCESTNTKFCYFNNYSLSQPRHFCKTCRRYWTRGGALRNVPVGGGCRRNKRSKGSRSKSPVTAGRQVGGSTSTNSCTTDVVTHLPPPPPQLPFLPSIADYGAGDIGLNFAGIQTPEAVSGGDDIEFQMGSGGGALLSARLAEQWRLQQAQQFPFLSGLEPPSSGMYQFEGEGVEPPGYAGQLGSKALDSGITQLSAVKMEENQGLNMSRNFLGITGNDQYWVGNAWTDLCGAFTSSSTSHLL